MDLLIVESVVKAEKFQEKLGKGWIILPTSGHIMDIPPGAKLEKNDYFGVRIKEGKLELDWRLTDQGNKRLARLRTAIATVRSSGGRVYVGTDPDREGEAIAAHVMRKLRLPKHTPRALFQSMDATAVKKAIASPGTLDEGIVAAQEARRGLDRVVAYGLSRKLRSLDRWRKAHGRTKPKTVVGRVQVPALKACVDQYEARRKFKPSTRYRPGFMVNETFFKLPGEPLPTQAEALNLAQSKPAKKVMARKQAKRRVPPPPAVTTADVLKAFSDQAGAGAATAAMQNLFTDGLITYPRTDSRALNQDWVDEVRTNLGSYAGKGAPPGGKANQLAQEAHEAIRPTVTHLQLPEELKERTALEQGVYVFIARRAFGACMRPAEETVVTLVLDNHATARLVREDSDGWRRYEPNRRKKPPILPKPPDAMAWALKEGDAVNAVPAVSAVKAKRPQAPTVSWLVDWMDRNGVGRPATIEPSVNKIQAHGYVQQKKGQGLVPTAAGLWLLEAVQEAAEPILVPQYTKDMEAELDEIASSKAGSQAGAKLVQKGVNLAIRRSQGGGPQASAI